MSAQRIRWYPAAPSVSSYSETILIVNIVTVEIVLGLICIATGGLAAYGLVAPKSRLWAPVIYQGETDGAGHVALTFDDGPTPESTPQILDILKKQDVRCAFFVIGERAEKYPDLIRRMDAEGHLVCNHSYHHAPFATMRGTRYWLEELRRTDDVIENIIGKRPALFRPPMGLKTGHVGTAAKRNRHAVVTWSRRAFDGIPTPPAKIVRRLLPSAQGGDIILLHDKFGGRNNDAGSIGVMEALDPLIDGLRKRQLAPVRLDRLIRVEPYETGNLTGPQSV